MDDYPQSVWGSARNDVFIAGASGIYHYDGDTWQMQISSLSSIEDVWGNDNNDVFAVGLQGEILHYDGTSWTAMESEAWQHLDKVWGYSGTDVFATGWGGFVLHYDGTSWTTMTPDKQGSTNSIWGSSSDNVFAVGDAGVILRYDGEAWTTLKKPSAASTMRHVWGTSSSDVFAVGDNGKIIHFDGTSWKNMTSAILNNLYGVWGDSHSNVYTVGDAGTILHYNEDSWSAMESGTSGDLASVWGTSYNNIFAVGATSDDIEKCMILHYDGTSWSIMDDGLSDYTNQGISDYTHLMGVWGSSRNDVFAIGTMSYYYNDYKSVILHYNGITWSVIENEFDFRLSSVWGSSGKDVFVTGSGYKKSGILLHYNGISWSIVDDSCGRASSGVWGASNQNVYAVGSPHGMIHFDGNSWTRSYYGSGGSVCGGSVWVGSNNDMIFTVGKFSVARYYNSPKVTLTIPFNREKTVPVASNISAKFSKPINPSTISNTSFSISDGTQVISGSFSCNSATATFTPTTKLKYNTTYTATITPGVIDLDGIRSQSDYTWSFKTGNSACSADDWCWFDSYPEKAALNCVWEIPESMIDHAVPA